MPRSENRPGRFDKGAEALIEIHLEVQSDVPGKGTGGCGKVRKSYGGCSQKAAVVKYRTSLTRLNYYFFAG